MAVPNRTGLSRRSFLRAGAGMAGLMALGGAAAPVLAKPGGGGGSVAVTGNTLYLPPGVTGTTDLTSRRVTGNTVPGQPASYLGYSTGAPGGTIPGPTLNVARGGSVNVAFTNELVEEPSDSTVHWHGMVVPTAVDGQPQEWVSSGGTLTYGFNVDQRATMNWYHPHPHEATGEQVALGLAGAVLIRDAEESALALPTGGYEIPLIIRDADIDRNGELTYKQRTSGYLGKIPLVNGTQDAALAVEPAIYRFRVLNGANGRVMELALGNGGAFTLVGVDGGLQPRAHVVTAIDFSMAERVDVLVDFRGLQGQSLTLRDELAGWDLLTFEVGIGSDVDGWLPADGEAISTTAYPFWTPGDPVPSPHQTFSFDGMSRINGASFDMQRVDAWIKQGDTEVWRFTTGGNGPHPVHVHGEYFQVLSGSGGRRDGVAGPDGRLGVFPWEDGPKDTVLLHDGETVDVMVNFSAYPGFYLMHCHKLEHEDAGMMLNFNVYQQTQQTTRPLQLTSYSE